MKDKLDIYFSKVFSRLRNKTQLLSANADDHYHTRMQHTLEVEEIACKIGKMLNNKKITNCNLNMISKIALLHDIGHTPFGHAGEQALNEMTSGERSFEYNLPDFVKMEVAIGFKHNFNSGMLFRENVSYKNISYKVLDGIVKHSKLYYPKYPKLDYGFEYIFQGHNKFNINQPLYNEGLIVKYADEIAQVCSDYLDLNCRFPFEEKFNCKPFNTLNYASSDKKEIAKSISDKMISLFVNSFSDIKKNGTNSKCKFIEYLNEFDKKRSEILKEDTIKQLDDVSKEKVRFLFAHFYLKPEDLNTDFYGDFVYRLKRLVFAKTSTAIFVELVAPSVSDIKSLVFKATDLINNPSKYYATNSDIKDYRTILKMYIRSIAVYISKMTDNYANHMFEKYKNEENQ